MRFGVVAADFLKFWCSNAAEWTAYRAAQIKFKCQRRVDNFFVMLTEFDPAAIELAAAPRLEVFVRRHAKFAGDNVAPEFLFANEGAVSQTAKRIAEEGLSVRETEKLVKKLNEPQKETKKKSTEPSIVLEVELALCETMGTRVKVELGKNKNSGTLNIDFDSIAELFEIANKIEKLWNDETFFQQS